MEIKKTLPNSIAITGPLSPFGQQVTLNVGSDQKMTSLVDLSSARLRMIVNITGTLGLPCVICKPYIAWITTYTFTPTFKGGKGETRSVLYTGNPGRGNAGYVYSLMDRSAYNTLDQSFVENNRPPFSTMITTLDVSIPFRYLIDPLCTKRYLPISYFSFVPTFDTFLNIFAPGDPSQTSLAATVNAYYLEYPSYIVKSMPMELMYPDPRLTFIQTQNYSTPTSTILQTINVPGKLLRIFYFFVQEFTSTFGPPVTQNPFNFAANQSSVINQHQLTGSGKVYPLNPVYNAVFTTTSQVGLSRHYEEFMCNINKFQPSSNTIITYTEWRDNVRIYSIEVNDDGLFQQTILNFQAQFSTPTSVPFNLYIVSQYLPSVANLKRDAAMNQASIE